MNKHTITLAAKEMQTTAYQFYQEFAMKLTIIQLVFPPTEIANS